MKLICPAEVSLVARPMLEETWYVEAAQLMARTGCSLKQACTELDVPISNEEATVLIRRASFTKLLWQERHRFFRDLGADPNFSKDTAIGKLLNLAQKLEEDGEFDKAGEVIFKIAKMTGWVGPESTVSVFGELSQRDLDAIRTKIKDGDLKSKSIN
jgi:hypothetical protein